MEITKTIMLSTQRTEHNIKTFLIPLANIKVWYQGDESYCVIPTGDVPSKHLPLEGVYKFVSWRLTNDARSEWSADWGDMGCFVLVQKFADARIERKPSEIIIHFDEKKSAKDVWIPDRVRSDMYDN